MREIGEACGTHERQERCLQGFGGGDLRGRDNLEDTDVNTRIILQDMQCTLNATLTDKFAKPVLPWKSSNYCKFRVYVCSLSYPARNAWRRILPSSGWTIFFHIPHKRHDFRGGEKKSYWMQNVFWFSLRSLSEAFPILRRSQWDIIVNVHTASRAARGIPVRFYLNLYSLDKLSKNTQISNFIKIHPVGTELLHAGTQTWRT